MDSREYLKRVWRVPRDRGAATYAAALVHKALVKHGWPARVQLAPKNWGDGFVVEYAGTGGDTPPDFRNAVSIACRVVLLRTHKLEFEETDGLVLFLREYQVTSGGFFKEVKP